MPVTEEARLPDLSWDSIRLATHFIFSFPSRRLATLSVLLTSTSQNRLLTKADQRPAAKTAKSEERGNRGDRGVRGRRQPKGADGAPRLPRQVHLRGPSAVGRDGLPSAIVTEQTYF